MAIQKGNILMQGASGSFNKQLTFKLYGDKTVITRYPDMSKVVYTKAQIAERLRFKLAVAYARTVIADPNNKKAYSSKKYFSAYHAAIADYMNRSKAEENGPATPESSQQQPTRSVQNFPPPSNIFRTEIVYTVNSPKDQPPA